MPASPDFDLYEELEVSRRASPEVVKAAYTRLARIYHPDTGQSPDVQRMSRLNRAYGILSDPSRRSQHDRTLQENEPAAKAAPPLLTLEALADRLLHASIEPTERVEAAWSDGTSTRMPDAVAQDIRIEILWFLIGALERRLRAEVGVGRSQSVVDGIVDRVAAAIIGKLLGGAESRRAHSIEVDNCEEALDSFRNAKSTVPSSASLAGVVEPVDVAEDSAAERSVSHASRALGSVCDVEAHGRTVAMAYLLAIVEAERKANLDHVAEQIAMSKEW